MGELHLAEYIAVGLVLMAAIALQGAVGFAAGLFGIPLLMQHAGMRLPTAITTMLLASFIQALGGLYYLRKDFQVSQAWTPMVIRIAALPLGLLALHLATSLPEAYIKAVVGCVILSLLILQWTLAPSRPTKLHPAWTSAAFGSSGFLVGFCGMGGPPIVLWVMAQPWTAERSRAFLFFMFTSSLLPHCLYMWWMYPSQVRQAGLLTLLCIPWIVSGTVVGLWLGKLLPKSRLRVAAYIILVIMATKAICMPLMGGS